jgi:hypothetical protein
LYPVHRVNTADELPEKAIQRHQRIGWTALAVFVALGMGLEALHAFKIQLYLDVAASPRRFMWTLAHAHGTLLALVNLAYAALLSRLPLRPRARELCSASLLAATILVPGGFFLGGVRPAGSDPGLGVLLVPIGGAPLVAALVVIAWSSWSTR